VTRVLTLTAYERASECDPAPIGIRAQRDAISDAGRDAWNTLAARPDVIRSIGLRDWTHIDDAS
jgi:hypothetical protein